MRAASLMSLLQRYYQVAASALLLLFTACSAPLLPPAHVSASERRQMPDESVLQALETDWGILQKKNISKETRAAALARYNENAYRMMCRYRADLKAAFERSDNEYMPKGVKIVQDDFHSNIRLRDIYEDLVPAADVNIESLQERYTEPGLGVPMVGIIPENKVDLLEKKYSTVGRGTVQGVTAVFEFPKNAEHRVLIRLIPRSRHETHKVGKVEYPLACDISAPIEVYWNLTRVKEDRFLGMLKPQELRDTTGLTCIDYYNEKKIPVILTHGILSSAGTFDNLVNRLLRDSEIRNNYQFWYYNYPTGVAWTVTARQYREALAKVRRELDPSGSNKNWDQMVVVGHSMGGLITHYSQCTEPWKMLRNRKLGKEDMNLYMDARYVEEKLPFAPNKGELQFDYYFRPVEAARVIYLATPHRGAPMAQSGLINWLMRLVDLPQAIVEEVINVATLQEDILLFEPSRITEWFTSGSQLSPDSYSIQGLQGLTVRNVPTHSVIGDRGRGDTPDSSDGVVPYWSSHIAWGSEKIVPADHSVQDAPETADEVARILKEHLKSVGRSVKK